MGRLLIIAMLALSSGCVDAALQAKENHQLQRELAATQDSLAESRWEADQLREQFRSLDREIRNAEVADCPQPPVVTQVAVADVPQRSTRVGNWATGNSMTTLSEDEFIRRFDRLEREMQAQTLATESALASLPVARAHESVEMVQYVEAPSPPSQPHTEDAQGVVDYTLDYSEDEVEMVDAAVNPWSPEPSVPAKTVEELHREELARIRDQAAQMHQDVRAFQEVVRTMRNGF